MVVATRKALLSIVVPLLALFCGCARERESQIDRKAGRVEANWPLCADPTTLDLGRLIPGDELTAFVTLRNPGTEPLIVERLYITCDCVQASPRQFALAPGGDQTITVTARAEPGTHASLAVEIDGVGNGRTLFRVIATFTVD